MSKLPSLAAALSAALALAAPTAVLAKLPAPSAEAKAKADEAKAKTAHGDKVSAYKLCLAMDRTAAHYYKAVFDGLADFIDRHFEPGALMRLLADPEPRKD